MSESMGNLGDYPYKVWTMHEMDSAIDWAWKGVLWGRSNVILIIESTSGFLDCIQNVICCCFGLNARNIKW